MPWMWLTHYISSDIDNFGVDIFDHRDRLHHRADQKQPRVQAAAAPAGRNVDAAQVHRVGAQPTRQNGRLQIGKPLDVTISIFLQKLFLAGLQSEWQRHRAAAFDQERSNKLQPLVATQRLSASKENRKLDDERFWR